MPYPPVVINAEGWAGFHTTQFLSFQYHASYRRPLPQQKLQPCPQYNLFLGIRAIIDDVMLGEF